MLAIRDVVESDYERIISLNDAEVSQTSPMDINRLGSLIQASAYSKVATEDGQVVAFLIALGADAGYENENFSWFKKRFADFLYVDRIVVSAEFSGRRIGSKLYADLFGFARSRGLEMITCEYNIEPPNPASRVFHDKFGFSEVGTQWVSSGTKHVSLQMAETQPITPGGCR